MRRSDREITDFSTIIEIIESCDCCRLGFVDEKEVYIVPMSFGYEMEGEKISLFFHSAKEGRKIELLPTNRIVSFEMDSEHYLKEGNEPCSFTFYYQSIMGKGVLEIVPEGHEKNRGMKKIMEHYSERKEWGFNEKALDKTVILKLSVTELSAKANRKPQ